MHRHTYTFRCKKVPDKKRPSYTRIQLILKQLQRSVVLVVG